MKKNLFKGLSAICTLSLMTALLAGCDNPISDNEAVSEAPQSVGYVLGVRRYSAKFSFTSSDFYDTVYNSAYSWGSVNAVAVDGDPKVQVAPLEMKKPEGRITKSKRKQLAKNNSGAVMTQLATVKAKKPEADTLRAIKVCADALRGEPEENEKKMIICDSGLSTTGALNFCEENLFEAPVETVVEELKAIGEIPDLTGISVTWLGCGDVCGEQATLTSENEQQLEALWTAILTAGGAEEIHIDSTQATGENDDTELPPCSTVPIVHKKIDIAEHLPEVTKLDENSSVKFIGDKAEFIDPTAAATELAPIAKYLIAHPQEKLYIVGMTASVGGPESGKGLSLKRAQTCKTALVNAGVDESRLICMGMGQIPNSLRTEDTDKNGRLIEEKAKINRAVFFIKADSAVINELTGKGGVTL